MKTTRRIAATLALAGVGWLVLVVALMGALINPCRPGRIGEES